MLPRIGLTPAVDDAGLASLPYPYSRAIELAGALPLPLANIEDGAAMDAFLDTCDGIFFTGGMDIVPARYGEVTQPFCGETQPKRDTLELALLEKALGRGMPILAICRGCQLVNVFFGGTLYQDLPTERKSEIAHRQTEGIYAPSHDILIAKDTPLFSLTGAARMVGNSFHHQAVKTVGDGLAVMAEAEDGVIEGLYAPGYPYLRAYQWHPERLYEYDEKNRRIFADFLAAASKK